MDDFMSGAAITSADMQAANEWAAANPPGRSTPDSRAEQLRAEYERASRSISAPAVGQVQRSATAVMPESRRVYMRDSFEAFGMNADERGVRWSDNTSGGFGPEREGFGQYEQTLYGLGRALERATQEARFGTSEPQANGALSWATRLRKA